MSGVAALLPEVGVHWSGVRVEEAEQAHPRPGDCECSERTPQLPSTHAPGGTTCRPVAYVQ